jgi:hypothetical protein
VALVLTEPALTNVGIVHPEPGFHDALRTLTRESGTLLAIDETHTICCGPGGFTQAHGLEPDVVTIGKPIAGGIPAAAYGFADELAGRIAASIELEDVDVGGVGGTLAANALSLAAMRATLAEVTRLLEQEAIEHWLFGGWAVDFYAGRVTRHHDDVDLAVWLDDVPRIEQLLLGTGWEHAPDPDEDGGTGYERDRVRLELTYLRRREDGDVVIPLRSGEVPWRADAFGDDVRALGGVSAPVMALPALREGKSSPREEQPDAAKDEAAAAVLSRLSIEPASSSTASRKTSVCRSTSASVVAGDINAMLWNGVSRIPRLRA